ncbi:50S ribosomal protein L4 [Candidatus Wolfebacteria bacterium]|nr:50S ribosomal protein L4 [Candidatus Wolfebacteria bacterium]
MAEVKVYNKDGNVSGEIKASGLLLTPWSSTLVHQVFKSLAANRRQPVAHTKTRDEVRGGGKKPWRQKGTGRARHGSTRSPIWIGGGTTFGPRSDKSYEQKINKKMLNKAFGSALAKKAESGELKIVDSITISKPKTKELSTFISKFTDGKKTLVVVMNDNENILRAAKNLKGVKAVKASDLGLYEVLTHQYVLVDQKAFDEINK